MKNFFLFLFLLPAFLSFRKEEKPQSWIRINQLGYTPSSIKVAVWCSKIETNIESFELLEAVSNKVIFKNEAGKAFGKYGPFTQTYRLDFSSFKKKGSYYLKVDQTLSPIFKIDDEVYKGAADFCLRYMRQQRSGFNPFLKDSCHTHDGYTMYAPVPDGTHINVVGGWHDASDYLQYSTTSANATYHLLAAYRDFPHVFGDQKKANGLDGKNNIADVLDEAKWGLDWLLKMHPKDDWLFNQLGDDRDHKGMRIPKEDTNYYGHGFERPVYFCTGQPQQRGKFMNTSTGVASTAGKFASCFALGSQLLSPLNKNYADLLQKKTFTALQFGINKPGACQTVSVLSPYIYAEDNWTDDMELAFAAIQNTGENAGKYKHLLVGMQNLTTANSKTHFLDSAYAYAKREPITPWLGADTAKHYQWYPFINVGHYELAKQLKDNRRDTIVEFYKQGIEKVWRKAQINAFYRGVPFIWCSNNLTVAFDLQCYWYKQLSGDTSFNQLEQSNLDWIFGCNPWGTSMVYGLPAWGDTPVDPHSAFTHIKKYPIDGGLIDGPVYTSIYKSLIGIHLQNVDSYADFQSDLAVYHDDYGDYSTNEPTMDGTAVLIYLLAAKEAEADQLATKNKTIPWSQGAVTRGDSTKKYISLVFTGDEFGEGLPHIIQTLNHQKIKGSFFFTGRFYRNKAFLPAIKLLYKQDNYMGPHSDAHLLYNDWTHRDSLLVTKEQFTTDLIKNYKAMASAGISISPKKKYFIPPYEWWNDSIAAWSKDMGIRIFSLTPGTGTNADYTFPAMGHSYKSSEAIFQSVKAFNQRVGKLNGTILLIHAGTDPQRKDKLYNRLDELIAYLKSEGYQFTKIDETF